MWLALPEKRSPAVDVKVATDVYTELRRLLVMWRDDPDRLAVACACYTLAGYASQWLADDVASGDVGLGIKSISSDAARQLITSALRGRHHRLLRAKAEGLLYGLEALAQDAFAAQLHAVQIAAGARKCTQVRPSAWKKPS